MSTYLCCGVAGPVLEAGERALLTALEPGGIVLFARNIVDFEQVRELVDDLHALPGRPYVAVDLEGGKVNRLRGLLGALPSAAAAAAGGPGAVAALGHAAGAACASLGIDVDFAPVVDVACPGGWLAGESRCFGCGGDEVAANAQAFLEGLESHGVLGCLKHYPGLGSGGVDSHRSLPVLADGVAEEAGVFEALAGENRAVMIAHALTPSLGEAYGPASLSTRVLARLATRPCGPILADDLEMGALAAYGSLPERAAAALGAGCDQVLVCNAMEARAAVVAHVEQWRLREPRLDAALERGRRKLARFAGRGASPLQWREVEELAEAARRLAAPAP